MQLSIRLGRTFAERRLERVSVLVDGIEWNGKNRKRTYKILVLKGSIDDYEY